MNANETDAFKVDDTGGYIPFINKFEYLGSTINFLLDDTIDISTRIKAVNKAMGAMNFIWNANEVSLETKYKLYMAIPVNFTL